MRNRKARRWLWAVVFTSCLRAQTAPAPELGLDVNGQTDATASRGWPLLIRVALFSADGQQLNVGLKGAPWTQALRLTVTDQNGVVQNWPMQLAQPASRSLSLSGVNSAEAVWMVAPTDTQSIAVGAYNFAATLDTTSAAAGGAWAGSATSNGAGLTMIVEPASLSSEDEASKYLALAAYARLKGDKPSVGSALDTLIAHQPAVLEAYIEKAALLESNCDYAGALAIYQDALARFLTANPDAPEPLTIFTLPADRVAQELAGQQSGGGCGVVTSEVPGSTSPVFAPDSIVTAYGSGLATGTASVSGSPSTQLEGTTVTIKDSSGASTLASLFYVSPSQLYYAAPTGLALGAATVTVKTGQGSTSGGIVTIAGSQPGLFTLNAAGLIAGSISRTNATGQQAFQNLYAADGSGNVAAVPVDVSKGQVYLILYATGIRHAPQNQITVSINGIALPVAAVGAEGTQVGLDQVTVLLPASLTGSGDVPLILTVAGKRSNTARISIK